MRPEAEFVKRLGALFGEPSSSDPAATVAEYANAMRGQSVATLQAAADILRAKHRIRTWPTVAECLDAVAAAKKRASVAAETLEPIEDFDGWWGERMARITTADGEAQIAAEIRQIEPYASARMIGSGRMSEATTAADKRRSYLTARRMTGEAAK